MLGRSPHLGQWFGAFQAHEVLRESDDWILLKCRSAGGSLAAVKAVTNATAHAQERLRHEAELLADLARPGHARVVRLLEYERNARWYATAWVNGWSLAREYRRGVQPSSRIARIGRTLAEALDYVHSYGVVHGDVSPANVLVNESGDATLVDFGSATRAFESAAAREIGHASDPRYGTAGYIAPERLSLGIFDVRSDLYSLGCILGELATGKRPPQAAEALGTGPLSELIRRLLEEDPAKRHGTAAEVRDLLVRHESEGSADDQEVRQRPTLPLHKAALVGRTSAVERLMASVDRAISGSAELVLIGGESGIGKTSLLNEAARQSKLRGCAVHFGRCHNLLANRSSSSSAGRALGPFLPFLVSVGDTLRDQEGAPRTVLDDAMDVLADYEPTLSARRGSPFPVALPPSLARTRVLRSLGTVLSSVSMRKPLVLVLDDVQWADDLSLSFFTDDSLALDSARLCVIAAYRSDELSKDVERRLTARASGAIQLERLSVDEVAILVSRLLGSQLVPAQVSELLHRHSAGNPFLVVQYLHSLIHQGVLQQSADETRAFRLTSSEQRIHVPTGLRELFETRIACLSPGARRVLSLAAVLGSEFGGGVLERGVLRVECDLDSKHALSELLDHRLLETLPGGRYRFVHDKLREAQLSALAPEVRSGLHRVAAELLDAERTGVVSASELGLHFAEAGDPARALPHLETAADVASERHANAESIELYALALRQLRALNVPRTAALEARELRLAEARGDVLFRSGRNDEALDQYAAVIELCDAATRSRLKRKQAAAAWTAHDYDAATAALDDAEVALAYAGEEDTPERTHSWIEIQQSRFWLHYFARRAGPLTEALIERMRPVVERHGTTLQRSVFFECAACHVMARDRYSFSADVVASARRGLAELQGQLDDAAQVGSARFVLALSLVIGDLECCREAAELLERNVEELEPIGDATLLSRSLVYLSMAHRRLGRAEAAGLASMRARRYAERARLTPYIGAALACEAWLSWRRDNRAQALRLAFDAHVWWRRGAHVFPFRWLASFVALDIHRIQDDFSAAMATINDLLEPTQVRFAEPLANALAAARDACTSSDPREVSRKLDSALRLAHSDGYL